MKELAITIKQFYKCKSVSQVKKKLCGKLLGSGLYRDVYECKINPKYVIKIERDPSLAAFANVTEWRNYQNNLEWRFINSWLAPCILINETGQVLIQERVSTEGKRRKDYPKYVPSLFTDLKLKNFGWIGDRFVCCDYSYMLNSEPKMKYAKWWGSLKK